MSRKILPLIEYFTESTTACLVTMVQGRLLALTLGHLLLASQTGIIASAAASVAVYFSGTTTPWVVSAVLGIATALADFFVHPGQVGAIVTEALVTGLGAALLSYTIGTAVRCIRTKW